MISFEPTPSIPSLDAISDTTALPSTSSTSSTTRPTFRARVSFSPLPEPYHSPLEHYVERVDDAEYEEELLLPDEDEPSTPRPSHNRATSHDSYFNLFYGTAVPPGPHDPNPSAPVPKGILRRPSPSSSSSSSSSHAPSAPPSPVPSFTSESTASSSKLSLRDRSDSSRSLTSVGSSSKDGSPLSPSMNDKPKPKPVPRMHFRLILRRIGLLAKSMGIRVDFGTSSAGSAAAAAAAAAVSVGGGVAAAGVDSVAGQSHGKRLGPRVGVGQGLSGARKAVLDFRTVQALYIQDLNDAEMREMYMEEVGMMRAGLRPSEFREDTHVFGVPLRDSFMYSSSTVVVNGRILHVPTVVVACLDELHLRIRDPRIFQDPPNPHRLNHLIHIFDMAPHFGIDTFATTSDSTPASLPNPNPTNSPSDPDPQNSPNPNLRYFTILDAHPPLSLSSESTPDICALLTTFLHSLPPLFASTLSAHSASSSSVSLSTPSPSPSASQTSLHAHSRNGRTHMPTVGCIVPPHVTHSIMQYCISNALNAANPNPRFRSASSSGGRRGVERKLALGTMLCRLVPGAWSGSLPFTLEDRDRQEKQGQRLSPQASGREKEAKEKEEEKEGLGLGLGHVEGAGSEFGTFVAIFSFLDRLARHQQGAHGPPPTASTRTRTMSSASSKSVVDALGTLGTLGTTTRPTTPTSSLGAGMRSMSAGAVSALAANGGGSLRTRTNSFGGGPSVPSVPRFGFGLGFGNGYGFNSIPSRGGAGSGSKLNPAARSSIFGSLTPSSHGHGLYGNHAAQHSDASLVLSSSSPTVVDFLISHLAQKMMGGTREEAGCVMRWVVERWERIGEGVLEGEEEWGRRDRGFGIGKKAEGEEEGIVMGGGVSRIGGGVETEVKDSVGRRRGKGKEERVRIPFGRGIVEEADADAAEGEGSGSTESSEEEQGDEDDGGDEDTIHGHDAAAGREGSSTPTPTTQGSILMMERKRKSELPTLKVNGLTSASSAPPSPSPSPASKEAAVTEALLKLTAKKEAHAISTPEMEVGLEELDRSSGKSSFERMVESALGGSDRVTLSLADLTEGRADFVHSPNSSSNFDHNHNPSYNSNPRMALTLPDQSISLSTAQDQKKMSALSLPVESPGEDTDSKVFIGGGEDKMRLPPSGVKYKLPSASASSLSLFSIFPGAKERGKDGETGRDEREGGREREKETVGIGKRLMRRMSSMSLRRSKIV